VIRGIFYIIIVTVKRSCIYIGMVAFLLHFAMAMGLRAAAKDSLSCSGFGYLQLYKPEKVVTNVVICISGDGGWDAGIEGIALHLKDEHTLLIGVDIRQVFKYMNRSTASCLYPAADFERMSQFVQKKLSYKTYNIPILLGYSSGATLVYGLLAQAPQNTFRAGIVLGFCPDIDLRKPLCPGSGKLTSSKRKVGKGYNLKPVKNLSAPFVTLQGQKDQVCNYQATVAFLKNVTNAQVISLPNVGHGYGVEKNWVPQLMASYKGIIEHKDTSIPEGQAKKLELPLHLTTAVTGKTSEYMAVFISGDGGWTGFDQQTVNAFAEKGIPVAGLDALKYFWERKTPEETAADILSIIETYALEWKKRKVILMGYSFGADVVPFVYNRLPESVKKSISGLGLLSPSKDTDFEVHVSDLLAFSTSEKGLSVPREINSLDGVRATCFFGKEEDDLPVKEIAGGKTRIIYLQGGHHYTDSFGIIAEAMIPK
jgi:type IV secretory pathway VirJ component